MPVDGSYERTLNIAAGILETDWLFYLHDDELVNHYFIDRLPIIDAQSGDGLALPALQPVAGHTELHRERPILPGRLSCASSRAPCGGITADGLSTCTPPRPGRQCNRAARSGITSSW